MGWQQFVIDGCDREQFDLELLEDLLIGFGACSVTLSDAGDDAVLEPAPGETPLWGSIRVTALFDAADDLTTLPTRLEAALGIAALPPHLLAALPERDWEREWLKDFGPMQFGERLWVCPGDSVAADDAVVVHLDPGLAFGTGTHPTTALCLEWLDGLDVAEKTVLDYGCGSGILAIAALKLGAARATGMDIDPQAVTATRQNATDNGVVGRIEVLGSDAEIDAKYEIVVANILAGPLLDLAESIVTRLSSGGALALSGILSSQVNKIQAAYAGWIAFDEPRFRSQGGQEWALLSGWKR